MQELISALPRPPRARRVFNHLSPELAQRLRRIYEKSSILETIDEAPNGLNILSLGCGLAPEMLVLMHSIEKNKQITYTGIDNNKAAIIPLKQLWSENPQIQFLNTDASSTQTLSKHAADLKHQFADIVLLHNPRLLLINDFWKMLLHIIPLYAKPNAQVLCTVSADYDEQKFNKLFSGVSSFPELYAPATMVATETGKQRATAIMPDQYYAVLRLQPNAYAFASAPNYSSQLQQYLKTVSQAEHSVVSEIVTKGKLADQVLALADANTRPTPSAAAIAASSAPPAKPSFGFGFAGSKEASKKKPTPERTLATVLSRYKLRRDQELPSQDLALRRAANSGQAGDVAYLLLHGADSTQTTSKGATAIDLALTGKAKPKTVDALLRHGDPSVRLNYIFRQTGLLEYLREVGEDKPVTIASLGCGECPELPVIARLCRLAGVKFKYYGIDNDHYRLPKESEYPAEFYDLDASNSERVAEVLKEQQIDVFLVLNPHLGGLSYFWWMFAKTIPLFAREDAFVITTLAKATEANIFKQAYSKATILNKIFAYQEQLTPPHHRVNWLNNSAFRLELQPKAKQFVQNHHIDIFLAVKAASVKATILNAEKKFLPEKNEDKCYSILTTAHTKFFLLHDIPTNTRRIETQTEFKQKRSLAELFNRCNLPYPENPRDFVKALHRAAFLGNCADIKFLVERYGVDITETNDHGKTAIDYAIEGENPEALQLLKQYSIRRKIL